MMEQTEKENPLLQKAIEINIKKIKATRNVSEAKRAQS
jgi:hypothetical protein